MTEDHLDPVWAPQVAENLRDSDLGLFLEFASTACIPVTSCNLERALQVLYKADGNINLALERLLASTVTVAATSTPQSPQSLSSSDNFNQTSDLEIKNDDDDSNNIASISSVESNNDENRFTSWTRGEMEAFQELRKIHGKRFTDISRALKTKSTKECVEYYYLTKKKLPLRNSTPRKYGITSYHQRNSSSSADTTASSICSSVSSKLSNTNSPSGLTNINKVVNGNSSNGNGATTSGGSTVFPCKVCGRVFEKIKSRSAHMKRHKNE